MFLLASRYCDSDKLATFAWSQFAGIGGGQRLVQAICDFAHGRIRFDYMLASPFRSASDAFNEGVGVMPRLCASWQFALCRYAMNDPGAVYQSYLGDIGVPADPEPMDFSAWFEVYLNGRWYTYDARHNKQRIGRIVMARGRDFAADVALFTAFGPALRPL